MKEITLTQGYKTIVDNEDYEELSKYNWCVLLPNLTVARKNKERRSVFMARQIMNAPEHLEVDHIDVNRLNNQRSNLRLCTHAENTRNLKPRRGGSSIYKGTWWDKERQNWQSYITFELHRYFLGRYEDERQAALFYDVAAINFFGEFARLNFPEHTEFIKDYWREREVKNNVL